MMQKRQTSCKSLLTYLGKPIHHWHIFRLMIDVKYFLLLLLSCFSALSFSQSDKIDSLLNADQEDLYWGDAVVVYRSEAELTKLRRDVLKAYPFAIRAASIINQIEENTAGIEKKIYKKRYLDKKEKILRDEFEENLKKLTKTQGRYMVRLINRETGSTVYDLIKSYRNGLNAAFWQLIAKRFDSDLKSVYEPNNPESIDFEIEQIVEQLHPLYVNRIYEEIEIAEPIYRDFQR